MSKGSRTLRRPVPLTDRTLRQKSKTQVEYTRDSKKMLSRSDPETLHIPGSKACSTTLSSAGILRASRFGKSHSE